jgi:hypothetical protein
MISKTINRTTRLALCFLKTGELSPVFLILKQKKKGFYYETHTFSSPHHLYDDRDGRWLRRYTDRNL